MEIVRPSYEIIEPDMSLDQERILRLLEQFGKICYQSKPGETSESSAKFICSIIDRGHESVIEHLCITVIVTCDRGVTHEWVRHRIASYSQESTRYCNYGKKGVRFIMPPWMLDSGYDEMTEFVHDLEIMEGLYLKYLKKWADKDKSRKKSVPIRPPYLGAFLQVLKPNLSSGLTFVLVPSRSNGWLSKFLTAQQESGRLT